MLKVLLRFTLVSYLKIIIYLIYKVDSTFYVTKNYDKESYTKISHKYNKFHSDC